MKASDVKCLKDLEEEHARLKRMYVELSMDHNILKDVISKKGWGPAKLLNCKGWQTIILHMDSESCLHICEGLVTAGTIKRYNGYIAA